MLKDILTISGKPGLFKLVSKGRQNIIVESLLTGKRMPSFSYYKVVSLHDIAVFTDEAEKPLREVMLAIAEKENNGHVSIDLGNADALKAYFEVVLPNYDRDRVFISDMKKILSWYNLFVEKNMLDLLTEEETTENTEA